jgi:hypothetical protein
MADKAQKENSCLALQHCTSRQMILHSGTLSERFGTVPLWKTLESHNGVTLYNHGHGERIKVIQMQKSLSNKVLILRNFKGDCYLPKGREIKS